MTKPKFTAFPRVYFYKSYKHGQDAHPMVLGKKKPKVVSDGTSNPSMFQIIPIKSREDLSVVESQTEIQTRTDLQRKMVAEYKYVAIRCERGKFLSCRNGARHAEFKSGIGETEVFEVEYHGETQTFSFRSSNGKYLDVVYTFLDASLGSLAKPVVGFQSAPEESTIADACSWEVCCRLNSPPGEVRVEFVGVANKDTFEMRRTAQGSDLGEDEINWLREQLFEKSFGVNESMLMQDNQRGLRCLYLRKDENLGFVVVVSLGFSSIVAGECFEQLIHTHGMHRHKKFPNQRQIEKDLETLMWSYDYMEENTPEGVARRAKEEMERVLNEMLNDNIAQANDLNERAKIMEEQAEIFKKSNKRLKERIMR
eukprot:CAMPEP_0172403904 /NCGR_PEP_ID=MMETSP1061-20121228/61060_1 /TAXON_ID=37318 /ORGANISM="Pseudo-nitzschia pungens, Strain cf. pungens" /LENGTH=367 /DNA_ID=CAMNT_0013138475 /DNA_START=23 /DNA_END=1123 /DNA_ORIENTATION=-